MFPTQSVADGPTSFAYPDTFSIPIYLMTDDSLEFVAIVFCYIPDSFELTSVTAGTLIKDNPTSVLTVTADNQTSYPRVALIWIGSDVKLTAPSGGHFATLNFRQFQNRPFECQFIIDTCTFSTVGGTEFISQSGSPYRPVCLYPYEITCVGIDETSLAQTSASGELRGVHPNPFNSGTTIELDMPTSGQLSIVIYDILGRRVRTIADDFVTRGVHQFPWDGKNESGQSAASGVYFARITTGSDNAVRKLVLLR